MTIYSEGSTSTQKSNTHIRKVCVLLRQIIEFLEGFKDNYNKKFNVSKLAQYLDLSTAEIEELVSVLLYFQDQWNVVFDQYRLERKFEKGHIYLITTKQYKRVYAIPKIIHLSQSQMNLFNDIIYMFKYVRKGKGFSPRTNGAEIIKNVKLLIDTHPYLFEIQENEFIYPSQFGLELGELIISYNTSNKKIDKIEINDTTVIVHAHG